MEGEKQNERFNLERLPLILPQDPKLRRLVESTAGTLWRQPPYLHEKAMVWALLYFWEKNQGCGLTKQDVEKAIKFLEWVKGLSIEQVEREKARKREAAPLLLSERTKAQIGEQIKKLRSPNFLKGPNWPKILISFFRGHVLSLGRQGVFRQTVDNIRYLEQLTVKNIDLHQNKLRYNKQNEGFGGEG